MSRSSKATVRAGQKFRKPVITITNIIDWEQKTYSRCDAKGCDTYPAQISQSGLFYNIGVPQHGLLAKVWANSQAPMFVENFTLGLSTLVSHGTCEPTRN